MYIIYAYPVLLKCPIKTIEYSPYINSVLGDGHKKMGINSPNYLDFVISLPLFMKWAGRVLTEVQSSELLSVCDILIPSSELYKIYLHFSHCVLSWRCHKKKFLLPNILETFQTSSSLGRFKTHISTFIILRSSSVEKRFTVQ